MSTKSIKKRMLRRWLSAGFARVAQDGKPPNKHQLNLLEKDYKIFKAGGIDAVRPSAQLYMEWIIDEANRAKKEESDGNVEREDTTERRDGAPEGGDQGISRSNPGSDQSADE